MASKTHMEGIFQADPSSSSAELDATFQIHRTPPRQFFAIY